MAEIKPFDAIKYTTTSGENCTATKNNGIVTVQGDKNGVRQVPYEQFMKEFIEDQSKKTLERSPKKDTVTFSGKQKENFGDMDVEVKNKLIGGRTVKGTIKDKEVDLKITSGVFSNKIKLSGTINGKPVDLTLEDYNFSGNISQEDNDLLPYMRMLMNDKRNYDHGMAIMAVAASC